ncbi:MAG: HAD family hydrolase [Pseudomonadota bacterium]
MKFEAAIWDLDGTLIDSLEDIGDSMNRVLRREGLPEHGMDAYRVFIGEGIEKLVLRAVPDTHREEKILHPLITAMRKTYLKHMLDKTAPYPGIPEVLDELTARGLKQAVLSNKPDLPTQRIVSKCFSNHSFHLVTGALPDIPKKPDPTAALAIAEKLCSLPEAFLYFGDTATDMKTAVTAGMFPIGVLWGFRGATELLDAGARMLVKTPGDLLRWLKWI